MVKLSVNGVGHQRWLDNPQGRNGAGPGAVSRPGIGGETLARIALMPR